MDQNLGQILFDSQRLMSLMLLVYLMLIDIFDANRY